MNPLNSLRHERGSSVVELALVAPVIILLLVIAVDLGRAYFFAIETSSAAEAGAMYGAQNPQDTAGMIAAAKLDASDTPNLVVTAAYGCKCSDGSNAVSGCGAAPSCAFNVVNYVEVNTSTTYVPLLQYPGLPTSFVLTGKMQMRSAH